MYIYENGFCEIRSKNIELSVKRSTNVLLQIEILGLIKKNILNMMGEGILSFKNIINPELE